MQNFENLLRCDVVYNIESFWEILYSSTYYDKKDIPQSTLLCGIVSVFRCGDRNVFYMKLKYITFLYSIYKL